MSERMIKVSDERTPVVVFYDVQVDDAGLSPLEFRAYMRIVRRAGGGLSACTESLEHMAEGCKMSRRAMVEAIKGLVQKRMIRRESKSGHVSTYVLTDKSTWVLEGATSAPNAQVEGEGWAPYAQGVGTICPGGGHHMPTKNTNKNTSKETTRSSGSKNPHYDYFKGTRSSGSKNPHYDIFAACYAELLKYPYSSQKADFVQLAKWKTLDEERTSLKEFGAAVRNYLISPQGKYTLADLVNRFAVFRNSPLDRFGKPVETKTPTPSSAAPLPRPTCGQCVNGYILPETPQGRATKCSCQEVKNAVATI